ncbi:phage tail assembly protein T [Serratia sp. IR-2025]
MAEYRLWVKYRNKYGSLNPMMRTEWGAALVASTIANVNKKEKAPLFRIADFAPHIKLEENPISLDEAMKEWS